MKNFAVIVAATASSLGIGKHGDLPWKIPGDMLFFKKQTISSSPVKRNAVIMGRKTWESLPAKFRPLVQRINVILSKNPAIREELNLPDSVLVADSLDAALLKVSGDEIDQVYVIGGGSIYKEALNSNHCTKIYLTQVETDIPDLDTFFPVIPAHRFKQSMRSAAINENGIKYRFTEYDSIPNDDEDTCSSLPTPPMAASGNPEEQQYLDIVKDIINNGVLRGDRTGTGTLSKFGVQMRFSLRNGVFPLLTTKKVFWRGVAEELLWFVKGCTSGKELSDKGIHIWDGNGSREFLDSRGLHHREVGDLGPVYGFQWRHFGAEVMLPIEP
jgi:dihydrofolate reductase / thymidylate synthase